MDASTAMSLKVLLMEIARLEFRVLGFTEGKGNFGWLHRQDNSKFCKPRNPRF